MNEKKDPFLNMMQHLASAAPPEAPQHIGVRLEAAFRQHHLRRRRWRVAGFTGLAACLAIAITLVVSRGMNHQPIEVSHVPAAVPSAPAAPAAVATVVPDKGKPTSERKSVRTIKNHAPTAVAERRFLPLPGVDPRTLTEDFTIVRLKLSIADLGLVGVAGTGENSDEMVVADVLMDEDGTPYAFRLVN